MDKPESKLHHRVDYCISWVISIFGTIVFSGGFLILIGQVWSWLKYGQWQSRPLLLVVEKLVPNIFTWLNDTASWVGLKTLIVGALTICPLSLVLIVCGFPLSVYGLLRMEDAEKHVRRRKRRASQAKSNNDRRLLMVVGIIALAALGLLIVLGICGLFMGRTYWPPT